MPCKPCVMAGAGEFPVLKMPARVLALDVVADNGAVAVIQPGGSMRDDEVIAAADERGIAMVFTGMRHFRH